MKPTHPVELLAGAIATQEGAFIRGTRPWVNNNPGDLDFAHQLGAVRDPKSGPLAFFISHELGVAALFRQLWLQVAEGQTVRQIIAQWAPPSKNNTSQYLSNVLEWTGLPADVPVLQLLPELYQMNQVGPKT